LLITNSDQWHERPLATPIPPEDLIYLVNGHRDSEQFAKIRMATIKNMIALLSEAGVEFDGFQSILDFGCGCGRILAGLEHFAAQGANLQGFDINETLVRFCQENIPFAKVLQCNYHPPIPVEDASIDFAYAASVWTHMSLSAAMQWAGEFTRVVKPGGTALVSYHGSYFAKTVADLNPNGSRQIEEHGFYIHSHVAAADTWEGSNSYATFITSDFMRSLFKGFEVLRIYPGISRGPNPFASWQDIVVLRRLSI
jgi:SAM-dependent methyltransferase